MKVEIVKVKVNKLREVKKQMRKGSNKNENLKKLLISQVNEKCENELLCQSIIALIQDETFDASNLPSFSENLLSDHPSDFYDVLNSLDIKPEEISSEEFNSNFTVAEMPGRPGSQTCETSQFTDPISQSVKECNINNLGCLVNNCSEGFECMDNKIHLYQGVETGDIGWSENSFTNTNGTFHIDDTNLKPFMVELERFYTPNDLLNLVDEEDITAAQNVFRINPQSATSGTNKHIKNEGTLCNGEDILHNLLNESTLVNPSKEKTLVTPVNYSSLNLMVAGMERTHKNAVESHDYEEIELLKSYNSEQRSNIINAAKILYTKRTRTLLHWLDPKLPVAKMKYTLGVSWNKLPIWQKEVYVNQVLGPIVKETVCPMLNPQLTIEGCKSPGFVFTSSVSAKKRRSQK